MTKTKIVKVNNIKSNIKGGESKSERYAIFANVSYLPKSKRQKFINEYKKVSWKVDNKLSNKYFTVLYNDKTKQSIISVRGTDPKDIKDLKEDLLIATGTQRLLSSRLRSGKKLLDKVKTKYGDNIELTGHSLGGSIASQISNAEHLPAFVFNKGSSPVSNNLLVDYYNKVKCYFTNCDEKKDLTKSYHIKGDPVSITGALHEKPHETTEHVPKKEGKDPHTIENFIPEVKDVVGEGKKKRVSKWITFVKAYQKEHGVTYKEAMIQAKKTYKK